MSESISEHDFGDRPGVIPAPTPGVYPDTKMHVYHSWDAASSSRLGKLKRSPAHLLAYIQEKQKETPAKALGRAIHSAVLEPDEFPSRYHAKPEPDPRRHRNVDGSESKQPANTKAYKDDCAAAQAEHPETEPLAADDHATCLGIRDSAFRHPFVRPLLEGEGQVELSMVHVNRATGVTVKSRWDRHSPAISGGSIVDLKSTLDGSLLDFERSILKFGYHRQGWVYLDSATERHLPARNYVILAAEKEPPYAVAGYRISNVLIQYIGTQMLKLLELYGECFEANLFPAYVEDIREVSVDKFGWDRIDMETAEIEEQLHRLRQIRQEAA